MQANDISLELLSRQNIEKVRSIHREDVPTSFVEDADSIFALTEYGTAHHLAGCAYAIRYQDQYVGLILIGEAIPWECDPPVMRKMPFYRILGFVIDNRYRSRGIGGAAFELAIQNVYNQFGARPLALGVHKDNHAASQFYKRHGFHKADAWDGADEYYLRML